MFFILYSLQQFILLSSMLLILVYVYFFYSFQNNSVMGGGGVFWTSDVLSRLFFLAFFFAIHAGVQIMQVIDLPVLAMTTATILIMKCQTTTVWRRVAHPVMMYGHVDFNRLFTPFYVFCFLSYMCVTTFFSVCLL